MLNPIQLVINECNSIREISEKMRENGSISSTNDVPDVLDQAASLLSTIVISRTGKDPKDLVFKDLSKFEIIMEEKETNFIHKMEETFKDITEKMHNIQEKTDEQEGKYRNMMDRISSIHQVVLDNSMKKDLDSLKDQEALWEKERLSLLEEEKTVYQEIEKDLANQMTELSKKFTQQLKQMDEDINKSQLSLQNKIHEKHQQNRVKNDTLSSEERKMAAEHEKISREFQERKVKAEEGKRSLTEQISEIKVLIKMENDNSRSRLVRLESLMNQERKKIEDQQSEKLAEMNSIADNLLTELKKKQEEFDQMEIDQSTRLRALKLEYDVKNKEEQDERDAMIAKIKSDVEAEFMPKIESIHKLIAEEEAKRNGIIEKIRKESSSSIENAEKYINEITKTQLEEIAALNKQLSEQKTKLRNVLNEMEIDLENVKHMRQKEVGSSLQIVEEKEKKQSDQVSTLMKLFDEQQKKLSELHKRSVESRDKRKADEIMRMKQDHETRKIMILRKIESDIQKDTEEKLNQSIEAENQRHHGNVSTLQARIHDVKGRIDVLNLKIQGLMKIHNDRYEQYLEDKDNELRNDLLTIQKEGESQKSSIQNIKERLMNETQEVHRRKGIVLHEADDLKKNIQTLQDSFERRLTQMEHQYSASKAHLQKETRNVNVRQQQIAGQLYQQTVQINQLTTMANQKEEEVNVFENSYDSQKNEFEQITTQEYESSLEIAKQSPLEFQNEMEEIRFRLTAQIRTLQDQLIAARAATEKITELLLKERENMLEEAEFELKSEFEARTQIMKESHNNRIKLMDDELSEAKSRCQTKINDLKNEYEKRIEQNKIQFLQLIAELNAERDQLQKEANELSSEIVYLENKECEECIIQKERLRKLIAKRDEMETRIENLMKEQQKADAKLNSMFSEKKIGTISPCIKTVQISQRAKTSLAKRTHTIQ